LLKKELVAGGWYVYHGSTRCTKVFNLNATNAYLELISTIWNNTTPTYSSFFGTGIIQTKARFM
jgi:hypothetical protein